MEAVEHVCGVLSLISPVHAEAPETGSAANVHV